MQSDRRNVRNGSICEIGTRPESGRWLLVRSADALKFSLGWKADLGIYILRHMKQRTHLILSIATIVLAAGLLWCGPSLYQLYKDWPIIAACANDAQYCP